MGSNDHVACDDLAEALGHARKSNRNNNDVWKKRKRIVLKSPAYHGAAPAVVACAARERWQAGAAGAAANRRLSQGVAQERCAPRAQHFALRASASFGAAKGPSRPKAPRAVASLLAGRFDGPPAAAPPCQRERASAAGWRPLTSCERPT